MITQTNKKPKTPAMGGANFGEFFKDGYVLVVDDMPNMCKTIRNMLRSLGISRVVTAGDGDIALSILKNKNHPRLEMANALNTKCLLALLDWNLPRVPGIDVAQEIRADKELEDILILMVTAEASSEQITQASAETGVNGYILKPFGASDLEGRILNVVKRRINPPNYIKLLMAGETLMKQGQYNDSLMVLNRALETNPKSARIQVVMGELLKERGELEGARRLFSQAAVCNPQYLKTYVAAADLSIKEGRKDEALSQLKKARDISPFNAQRQAAMGKLYLEKGEENEAQKAFNMALKQDPRQAKEIAEAYLENGKAGEAELYFRRSLSDHGAILSPEEKKEYVHTANRLGIALRKQGKIKEAIQEYQKARKLSPDDEAIYYNLGKAYEVLWKKEKFTKYSEKAKKCFNKALELDPGFEEAKVELKKLGN